MRIEISHTTRYRFDSPARHGLQRLHLAPRGCSVQQVVDWSTKVEGAVVEAEYDDHNQNHTLLVSFGSGTSEIVLTSGGVVETFDTAGVIGKHTGFMPLWVLRNQTPLTEPGPRMKALAARFALDAPSADGPVGGNRLEVLHGLSDEIAAAVAYEAGHTGADTTGEAALALGLGVCQDHAHIFIGAARLLGIPARYVSGYLLMDDRTEQDAGHAWAEAHVEGLGWVGFDVSNAICPDQRYVRVAVGADYRDAAPVTSLSQGGGAGTLTVELSVAEAAAGQQQQQHQQPGAQQQQQQAE